ncbi:MAG: glycosyltransferase family 4 protein [Phycisphaerae bacterium]|nr:glycosyltransferase family 4 protein [Phycisphaerae bacterium]
MPPPASLAETPVKVRPVVAPARRRGQATDTNRRVITVCHPVWRLGCGGLERQLLQTVENLPRDRFRHVLVVRGHGRGNTVGDRVFGENVEAVQLSNPGKDRLWSVRLASILREHAVDVLHVRGLTMLVDSLLAARMCADVRVAFSFHGFETPGRKPLQDCDTGVSPVASQSQNCDTGVPPVDAPAPPERRCHGGFEVGYQGFGLIRRRMYRAAALRCDDRWAVSRAAAEAIARELRMKPGQFGVLPNGVDTQRYVPAACRSAVRRGLNLPDDQTIILSVGNLKLIKGHDILLQALHQLRGDMGRATAIFAGGDYLGGALRRWAGDHMPGADIRFVSEQCDTLPWYQAADLFVLPSLWEGMSNALLEAMSCGVPVIATAVGGNLEVIDHGRTGLLVAPDNAVELGLAIRRLMRDETYRAALASAGRMCVQDEFAAPLAAARYEGRYARLGA